MHKCTHMQRAHTSCWMITSVSALNLLWVLWFRVSTRIELKNADAWATIRINRCVVVCVWMCELDVTQIYRVSFVVSTRIELKNEVVWWHIVWVTHRRVRAEDSVKCECECECVLLYVCIRVVSFCGFGRVLCVFCILCEYSPLRASAHPISHLSAQMEGRY